MTPPRPALDRLIADIKASPYFKNRPPLWMKKNRRYFLTIHRLIAALARVEQDAAKISDENTALRARVRELEELLREYATTYGHLPNCEIRIGTGYHGSAEHCTCGLDAALAQRSSHDT